MGAVRGSDAILTIGLITGIASIAVAVLAALIAKKKGETTRGFLVSAILGISGIAMYLLVTNV